METAIKINKNPKTSQQMLYTSQSVPKYITLQYNIDIYDDDSKSLRTLLKVERKLYILERCVRKIILKKPSYKGSKHWEF